MQEIEFARAVWRLTEAIFELGVPSEPIRRMMVSRLYYAAYHVALLLLRNAGLTPPIDRSIHQWALNELRRRFVNTGRMSWAARNALRELRRLRNQADYRLDLRARERDVRRAMHLFRTFFDECHRILGVT